jgi:hypothetical protein
MISTLVAGQVELMAHTRLIIPMVDADIFAGTS